MARSTKLRTILIIATALACVIPASASKQARGYAHGFEKGNLIPNWSFEALGQTWDPATKTGGFTIDPRFRIASLGGSNKAVSGSFVGKISGSSTVANAAGNHDFSTPYLPLRSTTDYYTVSFYVRASGMSGNVRPVVRLYREKDNAASYITSYEGARYQNNSDWTLVSFIAYPNEEANYFQLVLAESNSVSDGGTLYFDDVVMEEGQMTPRNRILEDVEFADALGRSYQGQSYASGSRVSAYPGWANSGRIRINASATGAGLKGSVRDFPLLVRLSGSNFNFGEAKSNGDDIRFTDAAGTPIPFETELWSSSSSVAAIWVRVPLIEGGRADNDIFMYWGNSNASSASSPASVFNENAGSILDYHLGDVPAGVGSMQNASNPSRNGNPSQMTSSTRVAGQIGYGYSFDGVNDAFSAYWSSQLSGQKMTYSAWVKPNAPVDPNYPDMYLLNQYKGFDGGCLEQERSIWLSAGKIQFQYYPNQGQSGVWESSQSLKIDGSTYYHVAVTYDNESINSVPTIYVNGKPTSLSFAQQPSSQTVYNFEGDINVGEDCGEPSEQFFHGIMDEMRFENDARSPDWIKLEYESEKAGSSVVTLNRNIHADQPTRNQNGAVTYDPFGRPDRSYLPCQSNSGDLADPSTCTADPDLPNMGGYPYAQASYLAEPGQTEKEIGLPGSNNRIGGGHSVKSDYSYVSTLSIPSNIETPPAATTADTVYRLTWSKDPDGNYSLSWQNRKGQTVQTASNITRDGTKTPNLWSWSITQNDYFINGSLKRVRTPLDVANGNTALSLVSGFDAIGNMRGTFDPDRGLVRSWYNRRGQVRYTQDAGQRSGSGYSYFEYDSQGRITAKGINSLTEPLTQVIVDQDTYQSGTKSEKIGYLYDNLSAFSTRSGVSLSTVMPDNYNLKSEFLAAKHGFGRLTCKYNKNNDSPMPGFGAADKLVAEFYLYNRDGSLSNVFKYFGPVRTTEMRYQEVDYQYDDAGRLTSESIYKDALNGTLSSNHGYEYDDQGRLKRVTGNYGSEPIAEFSYMGWGPLKSIILGGDGTGAAGTKIEYFYHTLGGIQEIRATQLSTGKLLFQQFLGYDGKANGNAKVPTNNPRYSGIITQQLYKFSDDVNSQRPVRVVNYDFDELGRMLTANSQRNGTGTALNTDGTINFNGFTFEDVAENDSRFTYDPNGRIKTQNSDGTPATATYNYKTNSYKLDNVTGRLSSTSTRDMSAGGTFVYNNRGAMTLDKSKDVKIDYDWNLMPVRFTKDATRNPSYYFEQYCFYDADGQRISSMNFSVSNGTRSWWYGKYYMTLAGKPYKEYQEQYLGTTSGLDYAVETVNLFGLGIVGRKNRGTTEYFLKDHLGSLRMTVDQYGTSQGGTVNDYLAYGDRRKLQDNGAGEPITQSFTGKEYEDMYDLYYFGTRWYDADLAQWFTPDEAGQYLNPYAYGMDPINGSDQDGNLFGWDDAIAAISGAAINYVSGGLHGGHWFDLKGLENIGNGALSAEAGWNTGLLVTGSTGCAVCGFAAGSAVASTISSGLNAAEGRNTPWTTSVGPISYTWGSGGGLSFAHFKNDWSVAGIFDNTLTAMNYAGAAGASYATFGAVENGTFGFQNPFNANSDWSLVNDNGGLSLSWKNQGQLDNFNSQLAESYQAANQVISDAYQDFVSGTKLDFKVGRLDEPQIPDNRAEHMFNDDPGHIIDTPQNRLFLQKLASDPQNFDGIDVYGKSWYSKVLPDGRQAWIIVHDGNITDGGINDVPRQWYPGTGFSGLKKRR